jgi:hypothetical protein
MGPPSRLRFHTILRKRSVSLMGYISNAANGNQRRNVGAYL